MSPDDPRHGTTAGHMAHMNADEEACDPCRRAKSRYEKVRGLYGDRMVPALGTRRRVRALMALGHSGAEIAARIGVTYQAVHKIEHGTADRIFARTVERVGRVYDELSMMPGGGYQNTRIRNKARRLGYAPPLAWDDIDNDPAPTGHRTRHNDRDYDTADLVDEATIIRILDGETLPANRAERIETMRRWLALGRSERSLCERLGWKDGRYVTREEGAA